MYKKGSGSKVQIQISSWTLNNPTQSYRIYQALWTCFPQVIIIFGQWIRTEAKSFAFDKIVHTQHTAFPNFSNIYQN